MRWLPWLLLAAGLIWLAFLTDSQAAAWFEGPHPKFLRNAARTISKFGDWPALVIAAALVGALGTLFHGRYWRIVCLMVLAASLAGLTSNVSRALTGRARPKAAVAQGWYGPGVGKEQRIAKHATNSFPSAHTTTATAYFVTLLILVPRLGIWLLPAPLLIGLSRLYMGVHHFSDVCTGFLLGTAVALFTCRVLAPQWPRFMGWCKARLFPKLPIQGAAPSAASEHSNLPPESSPRADLDEPPDTGRHRFTGVGR